MGSIILDRILVLISSIYDHDSSSKPAPEFDQNGNDIFSLAYVFSLFQIIQRYAR